ncbi:hypothetical protein [Kitasatospora indigofera]|uniref:hypothetical protein n=1 Tax=Kitasatospora indigofera TaxID=67307 RepID=UPI0033ACABBF
MLNVAVGPRGEFVNFDGYLPGHELAWASYPDGGPLSLILEAQTPEIAADAAFVFGNGYAVDAEGRPWPGDVRSVSVGDILRVTDPCGAVLYLAVDSCGFDQVDAPAADRIWPLPGSSATSR